MKKRQAKIKITKQKNTEDFQPEPPDSEEEEGFSKWLRSKEGIENLKLFVLGNSILVFLLISWPEVKETLEAAYYMYIQYKNNTN